MTNMTTRGQLVRDDSNFPAGYNYFFQNVFSAASVGNIALKPGILHTVTLDGPTSGTLTFKDGSSTIAAISAGSVPITLLFDVGFTTNLTFTSTATPGNITVSYISADK